jgi:prepilin-type N-terminal cleavage/methylation domain-containing protein
MKMNLNNTTRITKGGKENGFTLLEVIVAISILTIGILAVASMQISSIRGNSFAGGVTEGTTWAGDQVERLMALPYDHNDLDQAQNPHQATEGKYTINWNVTDDTPMTNTKTINVTVTWTDHGVQKTVSLQRVIPRII